MALRLLLTVAVVAGCALGLSGATDHIVGVGWNPNINYTLWSGNRTFFVGDLICIIPLPFHFSCVVTTKLHLIYYFLLAVSLI
jgi:hypothetical protein